MIDKHCLFFKEHIFLYIHSALYRISIQKQSHPQFNLIYSPPPGAHLYKCTCPFRPNLSIAGHIYETIVQKQIYTKHYPPEIFSFIQLWTKNTETEERKKKSVIIDYYSIDLLHCKTVT